MIKKVNISKYADRNGVFDTPIMVKGSEKYLIMFLFSIGLGYLTIETLKGILLELEPNLGDEQLMEIVEEVDEDGSGTIDFDGNRIDILFDIQFLIILP